MLRWQLAVDCLNEFGVEIILEQRDLHDFMLIATSKELDKFFVLMSFDDSGTTREAILSSLAELTRDEWLALLKKFNVLEEIKNTKIAKGERDEYAK